MFKVIPNLGFGTHHFLSRLWTGVNPMRVQGGHPVSVARCEFDQDFIILTIRWSIYFGFQILCKRVYILYDNNINNITGEWYQLFLINLL